VLKPVKVLVQEVDQRLLPVFSFLHRFENCPAMTWLSRSARSIASKNPLR